MVRSTGDTAMENFLIFSGILAMLVGLLAVIEGNLHCFGLTRRKKGSSWSPHGILQSPPVMRLLRGWWR
jgi:hypothetical protein